MKKLLAFCAVACLFCFAPVAGVSTAHAAPYDFGNMRDGTPIQNWFQSMGAVISPLAVSGTTWSGSYDITALGGATSTSISVGTLVNGVYTDAFTNTAYSNTGTWTGYKAPVIAGVDMSTLAIKIAGSSAPISLADVSKYTASNGDHAYFKAFELTGVNGWDYKGVHFAQGTIFIGVEDHLDGDFNDFVFAAVNKPAATPIPAAAWLLGSGLAGLVAVRRKRAAC